MTSHLSVSPVSSPAPAPASSQPASDTGPLGAFGAMLDGVQATSSRPNGLSQAKAAPASGNAASTDQAAASPQPGADQDSTTGFSVPLEATAGTAAADPTAEAAGTPPKLLKDLISALGDLDQAEQAGGPIDDKLLKHVKDAIDAIAAYLSGQPQLANAPATDAKSDAQPDGATAVAAAGIDKDAKAAAALASARTTLAKLTDKLDALSAGLGKDQADLADKLDALAKQLDPKALPKTTLGDLGLTGTDDTADARLAAAINALADGKPQSASAGQPKLAAPTLKLPDGTALTADKLDGTSHKATEGQAAAAAGKDATAAQPAVKPATSDPTQQPTVTSGKDAAKADAPPAKDSATEIASAIQQATNQPADSGNSGAQASAATAAAANAATAPAAATPDIRQAQSAYQTAPINLPQMAVEVARHVQQGSDHFQIRLDPPEMGRVNVQLAIDSSGTVNAHLTVERSETLDFLKRDQANLQQALQQAGLDAGKTNLQFSLSQNPFARQDNSADPNAGNYGSYGAEDEPDPAESIAAVAATTIYRGTASAGGLNLIV